MFHYDAGHNFHYVDQGNGCMLRLDGATIEKVANGADGVYFDGAYDQAPWEYLPERVRSLAQALTEGLTFADDEPAGGLSPTEQADLLMLWVYSIPLSTLLPTRPIALVIGPAGSGKTTLWRRLGQVLYGPGYRSDALTGKIAFTKAVSQRRFVAYDIPEQYVPWLEDALAAASTGRRWARRTLSKWVTGCYTAFVALTAQTPQFRRSDVVERVVPLKFGRLVERVPERQLLREVVEHRDELLADYIQTLNRILAVQDPPEADTSVRLADFAALATRVGRGVHLPDKHVAKILGKLTRSSP